MRYPCRKEKHGLEYLDLTLKHGGRRQNRTGDRGFAIPCITTLLAGHKKMGGQDTNNYYLYQALLNSY